MSRREQYKHLLNGISNCILLVIQTAIFGWVWYNMYEPLLEQSFWHRGNWAVIGMYTLFVYFFNRVLGGYRIGYLRIIDICVSQILAVLCANTVEYFELCIVAKDYMPVAPLLTMTAIEIAIIVPFVYIVRYTYVRLYPPRKMLVIYGHYPPDELIQKINTRKDKYNICGSISYEIGYEKLYPLLKEYNSVVLCDLPSPARNQIMKYCYQEGIRAYVTPKISDLLVRGAEDIHLFDTPLLLSRNQGLSIDQRFFKRIEDIVVSVLGIVITSPLMIFIALAIKLYDGGPVFYTQKRYTRDEQIFDILKFRSMSVHEESFDKTEITQKCDARVTPVGKILRRTHLDELPQLFNILKGEMSVVGPRAEWVNTTDRYVEVVPEFIFRLKVKAGLTGYAQVYGKYTTTPYDKVKLDITYIQKYSIWLDLKLILLTVKILFDKEKTEGLEGNRKTAIREDER